MSERIGVTVLQRLLASKQTTPEKITAAIQNGWIEPYNDVAESARASLASRGMTPEAVKAGMGVAQPAGHDTPGFFGSTWRAVGGPTSMEEVKHRLTPGPQWVPGLEQALSMKDAVLKAKTPSEGMATAVNQVNPMAAPMAQIGEGNYAGAAGSIAPQIVAALLGTKTGGRALDVAGPAVKAAGAGAGGFLGNLPFELSRPFKAGAKSVTESWSNRPQAVAVRANVQPVMEGPSPLLSDWQPTNGPLASMAESPGGGGSAPLRPVGDWFRTFEEAATGDAPHQSSSSTNAFVRPREIGSDYNPRTGDTFDTTATGPKTRRSSQFIPEPPSDMPPSPSAGQFISRKSIGLAEPSPLPESASASASVDALLRQYMTERLPGGNQPSANIRGGMQVGDTIPDAGGGTIVQVFPDGYLIKQRSGATQFIKLPGM